MAYTSYAGSLRAESSLDTIQEGNSFLDDNSSDGGYHPRIQPEPASSIHSPKSRNLLPPGHQSPTTRIPSGSVVLDNITNSGNPPRSRHGTSDSAGSGNTTASVISLNESELFRGAQYALAHLEYAVPQHHEDTATSVALSQHYRHDNLDRTERIEDANLTGISQMPKTPGNTTRRAIRNNMPESPSLPSSLRQAHAMATPRSKSVTFAPPPSSSQTQQHERETSAGSDPEVDGLGSPEHDISSDWARPPPSESSPPSRSLVRSPPRRSPSPLETPRELEPVSELALESSPSPSPADSPSPSARSSALLRSNRRSVSPSRHTSVANTPSRLRNVVIVTDTESSVDSHHGPDDSAERSPPPSRPSSRQGHSSPLRLSRTSVQQQPPLLAPASSSSPALFLSLPFQSPAVQSLARARSPAGSSSPSTVVTTGTGTFATAESFQNTPSHTTRTSNLSGTGFEREASTRPQFPSLFSADMSFSVDRDDEPAGEDLREGDAEVEVEDEVEDEDNEDKLPSSIENSLSRLTRAAQRNRSAAASAFAHLCTHADVEPQETEEEEEGEDGGAGRTVENLEHGAELVQEMHELHAALQANLLRRLQAAERAQVKEREERVGLEDNVKRLVVGLMTNQAVGDDVGKEDVGEAEGEREGMESLFGKFRAWALQVSSVQDRCEHQPTTSASGDTDRLLALQSELNILTSELERLEQAHTTVQTRVVELESERDELKDEQGVFEHELTNARQEREEFRVERDELAETLSLAQRRVSVLEVQVAEESAGRSQADAYRRRLEEGFEAQLADLRKELEKTQRENVRLDEERREVEERGREEVYGLGVRLREREAEIERLVFDLETEHKAVTDLEEERDQLIAAIPVPDDEEDARLAAKLQEAESKVGLQASRIKELEKQSANTDLEIAKLLKVRDRMEQENANYAMALAAKQQELSLLKRNSGRTSTANMTTAAMPLGMKTPRASDRHRDEQVDPPVTVRRRPPTAVLQSMILNTETPLPSSRIASRYKNGALHPESSGKESATETGMETEEESEVGDEVSALRVKDGQSNRRALGDRGVSANQSTASKPRLSSRASLGSVAGRASRVAVNDENAPPVSRASSSASIATATTTALGQINGAKRARSSLGAAALSNTTAATRASVLGARPASRASLGGISNVSSTAASRSERPRPPPPSRSIAPSPTPSMASASSARSFASSAASTSTRTGVLRSAATARKSGVEASRYAAGGGAAATPTPASASGRTNGGNVLGRDRVASRPRESGAMGRTSSSVAAPTTASAARTTLKRSTPDEDLDAVVRGSDHYSASTSAFPAASGSTTSLRSTIVAARHARPLGTSLSSISMGQSNRSMSTSAVLDGEMTEAEMSESVGPGPAPLPSMSLGNQRRPSRPSSAATSASGGAPVVTGRLSELSSNSSRSGSGYGGARAGVSVPGGARRPSYGVAAAAARVPSYERRMLLA